MVAVSSMDTPATTLSVTTQVAGSNTVLPTSQRLETTNPTAKTTITNTVTTPSSLKNVYIIAAGGLVCLLFLVKKK